MVMIDIVHPFSIFSIANTYKGFYYYSPSKLKSCIMFDSRFTVN